MTRNIDEIAGAACSIHAYATVDRNNQFASMRAPVFGSAGTFWRDSA